MKKILIWTAAILALTFTSCSPRFGEQEALDFLYRYMPRADSTDYSSDFFKAAVHQSFVAKEEMPWGKKVPADIFKHFVLPLRVNNESLDSARTVFYRELKPRVEKLSMKDAILEVNHWCHEKVTYEPSDARTSAPLALVRNALGRCGEESTFTVTALRSVGIPARQVYTPRWAHTDDNHAWVEAWADGKWWFMGACEPEPVLNLGWFNASASRAMLMHTKVFGRYEGPEEVVMEGPNYTEINLTGNYAPTAKLNVTVEMPGHKSADSAKVSFMIYNYSEFYPALSKYADAQGRTSISAGLGDMLVWAEKDGLYGYQKVTIGKDTDITIHTSTSHPKDPQYFDMVPPAEGAAVPEVSAEQRAANDRRFRQEDSLRSLYESSFPGKDADPLLYGARGNAAVIAAFLQKHPDARARELLASLSRKDLHDVTMEVLEDSYKAMGSILCPRVADEFLVPYKEYFLRTLTPREKNDFRNPYRLINWTVSNIKVVDDPRAWKIPQSPVSVFEHRITDPASRDVFFVSLARTMGIDARKDPVTGNVQFRLPDGIWRDVDFDLPMQRPVAPTGTLKLAYAPQAGIANPVYYTNFTISRIDRGQPRLLTFDEGEAGMADWMSGFSKGISLEEGNYIIVSGARLADGSVPATLQHFRIRKGETTSLDLILRPGADGQQKAGSLRLGSDVDSSKVTSIQAVSK